MQGLPCIFMLLALGLLCAVVIDCGVPKPQVFSSLSDPIQDKIQDKKKKKGTPRTQEFKSRTQKH